MSNDKLDFSGINYDGLPPDMRSAMRLWFDHAILPGGFLMAVLSNDLREACARADDINRYRLWDIVNWLYNYAPIPAWGSPERVRLWIERDEATLGEEPKKEVVANADD